MAKKKKEPIPEAELEVNNVDIFIKGAFVRSFRLNVHNKVIYNCWIKLSEIKSVMTPEAYDDGYCMFYTYKDCCYVTQIDENVLIKLINDFIYNKEISK